MSNANQSPAPERLLRRLEWRVIRRLDGLFQGDYRTLFYGTGIDFADLRLYQPEDDIRHIDWNVTARMNQLHVRQYVEDRELTAWFLLDLSPSMAFGPVDRTKQDLLVDLTVTLARLLTRDGSRVGAILYTDRIEGIIPPLTGRRQVLRLTRDLLRPREISPAHTTDLAALMNAGLNAVKRRSLIFVISDFISPPGWEQPLAMLNQRHELIALRLLDPRETELPDAGLIVVEDSETGEHLYVDTADPGFRRRFAEAAARREATLARSATRAGADLFAVSTEEDLAKAIVRLATLRQRRRR
ncbi:MAG: DUF58 domain-containing protein [Caldilineaceae bacterium]|nr:DUF58 domain-containing protein [Caldilineaceae bacterium]